MNSKKTETYREMQNDMNSKQITEGQILIANKPMKRCLTLPLIRNANLKEQ